jgi:LacI family gluconate utilization system Gnt-I transcriptional repressor
LHQKGITQAATITAGDERAIRRQAAFKERFSQLSNTSVPDANTGGPASIGAGRHALSTLIEKTGLSQGAIFCSSDLLAHGVLIEARARGLSVPGDFSVVGFGDQDFAGDLEPALTTVAIDRVRMGQIAAQALLQRMADGPRQNLIEDLGFRIKERAST